MSKTLRFSEYGACCDVTVVVARITHWRPIAYNGIPGTEIQLDTGETVRVANHDWDVREKVEVALRGKPLCP